MKRLYVLLSASALLTAGVITFRGSGVIPQPFGANRAKSEHSKEGESIRGALESKYSLRFNQETGDLDPQWMADAVSQADRMGRLRLNKNLTWENMGPDNVGGRTRAFLIHKDSGNIWFVGAVSGGLFRSTSFGSSWQVVNDKQENLSVNCIAQTLNGDIFYGTGEGGFTNLAGTRNGSPAFMGAGVFKNEDKGGTSFKRLPSTNNANFTTVNYMAAHPTENKLYVGTSTGIWVTTDGGTTFNRVRTGNTREIRIASDGTIFANVGNQLVRSTDGGSTYTNMTLTGSTSSNRIAIAVSPQDPNYVYCMVAAANGSLDGVYRSINKGDSWTKIISQSAYFNIFSDNNQGWFDNVISVNPVNKEHILMGGVSMAQWDPVNGPRLMASLFDAGWNTQYIHADKHTIDWIPNTNPPVCIVGSDGGLAISYDLVRWSQRNRGFVSFQCYNVAANNLGWVTGGSQDNGTQLINFTGNTNPGQAVSQSSVEITGGDGFDVEFSIHNPRIVFTSIYYGTVYRSANSGQAISTFWDTRIGGPTGNTLPRTDFSTIFTLWEHPTIPDSSRLFLAKDGDVWMCLNPTNFSQSPTWFLIAQGLGSDRIIDLEHTPDGNSVFVSKNGRVFRIDGINNATFSTQMYPGVRDIPAGISTTNITGNLPSGRAFTSVSVDPSNPDRIVVTLGNYGNSNYVYISQNALSASPSYTNITANLPSMPVYDAFIDFKNPNYIILGTDLGIYATETGGTVWEEQNSGMARVPVFEIRGYQWKPWMGSEIYIGTHGRGFFRSRSLMTNTHNTADLVRTASLNIYPNPAAAQTQLRFEALRSGKATLTVYTLNGQVAMRRDLQVKAGNQTIELNVSGLANGHYLTVIDCAGEQKTGKMVVSR